MNPAFVAGILSLIVLYLVERYDPVFYALLAVNLVLLAFVGFSYFSARR